MATIARPHVPEEELHAYCDGELSTAQRVEIAQHLLGCLICRVQHAEVDVLRGRVTSILALASPRQFGTPPLPETKPYRRAPRMMVAAAVALLGVGAAFSLQLAGGERATTQLATSLGESGFFRLGHGDVDETAIRARQLTMAGRTTTTAQVQAGPASSGFVSPIAIGKATEVDPVVMSEWTVASVDEALRVANGRLPHVPNIPVKLVRLHPSPVGGRPTLLVRQELPDGHAVWVLEGVERDIAPVDQLLKASGIATSVATRTRPEYVGTGAETAVSARMVIVVGYLPADSLNVLAQKLVLR